MRPIRRIRATSRLRDVRRGGYETCYAADSTRNHTSQSAGLLRCELTTSGRAQAVRPDAGGDGGAALGTLDDLWQDVQGYMHIIVSHEDLDEAEALMAQAKALSAQGSTKELYPVLAQLRHQFRLIAETQQLSPKNIF